MITTNTGTTAAQVRKNRYEAHKEAARQEAIEWQQWQSGQALSYYDLLQYSYYFEKLGRRYGLIREFHENGII